MYYSMSYVFDSDWSYRGAYMKKKHGVTPSDASEPLRDPWRVVLEPDPSSRSGRGIRVIGETAAGRLLSVIVMRASGVAYGVNGWDANQRDISIYLEVNRGQKP
jgi:uncharacterized DUF497 family protein